ncbi:DUF429 domain-containing protein [Pseudodesulfovibrio senegalensis]|jgi:predicted RNase H-like nuclease|uniref:DUF429 domain-containing protein n=1 Tax=Pseudodesulfovibrio senegalensis TaxID=1721087 RepID=A0A6N6N1B0_9BACT|nr:DUF429 domain-containing protein [Pseudodesulfovibrio senegalensis]KAB1441606.1 DUF429 domain-containing protein [Pseudodesulfovibrio senegalensis]
MKFVGADGCAAGWVAVALSGPGFAEVQMFEGFSDLWRAHEDAQTLLVDMPIGLPGAASPVREADVCARAMLGPRRSSVFSPPLREVLDCPDHASANAASRKLCGKGLSRQAWNIAEKIRQVDEVVRQAPAIPGVVREAHPEVCFAALAGIPMNHYKKTLLGALDRLKVLQKYYESAEVLLRNTMAEHPRTAVAEDDVLDALVLAVSAREAGPNLLCLPKTMPMDMLPVDGCGLPMAIWYHAPQTTTFKPAKG